MCVCVCVCERERKLEVGEERGIKDKETKWEESARKRVGVKEVVSERYKERGEVNTSSSGSSFKLLGQMGKKRETRETQRRE